MAKVHPVRLHSKPVGIEVGSAAVGAENVHNLANDQAQLSDCDSNREAARRDREPRPTTGGAESIDVTAARDGPSPALSPDEEKS